MKKEFPLKLEILGVALIILGLTMRVRAMEPTMGQIIGIGATWLGLILAVLGCFSRNNKEE